MNNNFYRAFEDRFRGSREEIIEKLKVYLPFVEKIKEIHGTCLAIDVGCGRGEWLQLLQENGVQAYGVDMDAGMLQACHELGLEVEQKDAIQALKAHPSESLSIVSGFHIVEHIDFGLVQELVLEALRVLRPGGLLILETPNAENIVVGTNKFYLDATHQRPLPALLLSFVTEFQGFSRNKILRLQEDPGLENLEHTSLLQVLEGISPDYAVIGQKPADPEIMASFDSIFSKDYGSSLTEIAERYDHSIKLGINSLNKKMQKIEQKQELFYSQELREDKTTVAQWQARCDVLLAEQQHTRDKNHQMMEQLLDNFKRLQSLEAQVKQTQEELKQAAHNAHHWYLRATAEEKRVNDFIESTSWRITAPLRIIKKFIKLFLNSAKLFVKFLMRPVLNMLIKFSLNRPNFHQHLLIILKNYPRIYNRLRVFALNRGLTGIKNNNFEVFYANKKSTIKDLKADKGELIDVLSEVPFQFNETQIQNVKYLIEKGVGK